MEDILWNYSWVNLVMLMLSIPKYDKEENTDKDTHEIKDENELMRLMV